MGQRYPTTPRSRPRGSRRYGRVSRSLLLLDRSLLLLDRYLLTRVYLQVWLALSDGLHDFLLLLPAADIGEREGGQTALEEAQESEQFDIAVVTNEGNIDYETKP